MNREEIIRMAEECGIPEFENNESQAENIMRFATLVASAERKACAEMVDSYVGFVSELSDSILARGEE